ncbi:UNVERIFIED_ORG: hypothetical protein GGR78_003291 [Xanthomonas campestris]
MDSAAWGLIGTLIGASTSIVTTYLTNKNTAKLHGDSRSIERIERARTFQRETLLELQNSFHDAIRATTVAHLADIKAAREGGAWGRNLLPDSLSEDVRLANRRVTLFVERVADDSVRFTVKRVMAELSAIWLCSSREESQEFMERVSLDSVVVLEEIGGNLRSLY